MRAKTLIGSVMLVLFLVGVMAIPAQAVDFPGSAGFPGSGSDSILDVKVVASSVNTYSFTGEFGRTYEISVKNGKAKDKSSRVTSARIVLIKGGISEELWGPSNFNKNAVVLSTSRRLTGVYDLGVKVDGKPGSFIKIEIK